MVTPIPTGRAYLDQLRQSSFNKSHHFIYHPTQKAPLVSFHRPGVGGQRLTFQLDPNKYDSRYPVTHTSPQLPSWLAFDKQALCFCAWFREDITESRDEAYRIRTVKLIFYPEDDTIQIVESPVKNSGIPQGTILRRHRVPVTGAPDRHLNLHHLNIGQIVKIYGREYHIVNCDGFTRTFLERLGYVVPPPINIPPDAYTDYRRRYEESLTPYRPNVTVDTRAQFLLYDKQVLRFYLLWDDRATDKHLKRFFIMHYYLQDDSIELVEIEPTNPGRDAETRVFLHRQRVPKHYYQSSHLPGAIVTENVLNVMPTSHPSGGRYMIDHLNVKQPNQIEYYGPADFRIGALLDIYNRAMRVLDCDDYTKEFYRQKFGVQQFKPLDIDFGEGEEAKSVDTEIAVPPHDGFGSEEDSLRTVYALRPKPPKLDFKKFMEFSCEGIKTTALHFSAKMITNHPIDKHREFTITFFLYDDAVQISERIKPNSGITGGKFLERTKLKKFGNTGNAGKSVYFCPQDFYLGAEVMLNGTEFRIIDVELDTVQYLETMADYYPYANALGILKKIATRTLCDGGKPLTSLLVRMIAVLRSESASLDYLIMTEDRFGCILSCQLGNCNSAAAAAGVKSVDLLIKHEVLTLKRRYKEQKCPKKAKAARTESLRIICQRQLRKENFEAWPFVERAFVEDDWKVAVTVGRTQLGLVPTDNAYCTLRACHVPIDRFLLRQYLNLLEDDTARIDYKALLYSLDWTRNPAQQLSTLPQRLDEQWPGFDEHIDKTPTVVNAGRFIEELQAHLSAEQKKAVDSPRCTGSCGGSVLACKCSNFPDCCVSGGGGDASCAKQQVCAPTAGAVDNFKINNTNQQERCCNDKIPQCKCGGQSGCRCCGDQPLSGNDRQENNNNNNNNYQYEGDRQRGGVEGYKCICKNPVDINKGYHEDNCVIKNNLK